MNVASRLVLVVGAFCALVAMASVSRAALISDTFTRADGTSLGSTESGGLVWSERLTDGTAYDTAAISGGELALVQDASDMAILNDGRSDLTATATMHFVGTSDGAGTTKGIGMVFRGSNMDVAYHRAPDNVGLVSFLFTNSGGLMIGENRTVGGLDWQYNANPFNGLGDAQVYGAAGSLPTAINGSPFDADGNGRLESNELFQIGAILSGTSIEVQINGETIHTMTLANTGGATGNYFAFMRNNLGGTGNAPLGAFDNLTITPEPGTMALMVSGLLGLLCYAWRKRK